MTVLLHPTLAAKPTLADALARRLNGEWEVCGGFCRLRPRSTSRTLRLVREWLPNFNPFPRDDGPRAA